MNDDRTRRIFSLLPDEAKGRYENLRSLGSGGMGEVLRVFDRRLQRDVALKVILLERVAQERYRKRFLREVRAMARLRHAGLVSVYDFHGGDGLWYYTMELVDGSSLRELLDEGPLPFERALTIARSMAAALATVHEARLLHRDLKPANVMVARDGSIRLMDFGLTKPLENATLSGGGDLTQTGEVVGTPAYLPPEIVRGKKWNRPADVFQFALVLYEVFTGERALRDLSIPRMLDGSLYKEIRPPRDHRPDLPKAVDRLLRACLHLRPRKRPVDGRAVFEALEGLGDDGRTADLEVEDGEAFPELDVPRRRGAARPPEEETPSRVPWVFGAVVLLFLLASVTGSLLGRGGEDAAGEARAALEAHDFPAWNVEDAISMEELRRLDGRSIRGTALDWVLGLARRSLMKDRELRRPLAKVLRRAPLEGPGRDARFHALLWLSHDSGPGTVVPEDFELALALVGDFEDPAYVALGRELVRLGRKRAGMAFEGRRHDFGRKLVEGLFEHGEGSPWERLALEEARLRCFPGWAKTAEARAVMNRAVVTEEVRDQTWCLLARRLAFQIARSRVPKRGGAVGGSTEERPEAAAEWQECIAASRAWADGAADSLWRRCALADHAELLARTGRDMEAEAAMRAARAGEGWGCTGVLTVGEALVRHVELRIEMARRQYPKAYDELSRSRLNDCLGWLRKPRPPQSGASVARFRWYRILCLLLLGKKDAALSQLDDLIASAKDEESLVEKATLFRGMLRKDLDPLILTR